MNQLRQKRDHQRERRSKAILQCIGRRTNVAHRNLANGAEEVAHHLRNVFRFLDEEHNGIVNADDGLDDARTGDDE